MNTANYTIVIGISYKHQLMTAYVNKNLLLKSRFLFDRHILSTQ